MTKFEKKIKNILPEPKNSLVVGTGFGHLDQFLDIFKTVFVISKFSLDRKARNLVYRSNINSLAAITNIDLISIDLDHVEYLNTIQHVWYKHRSVIIVEGREVIGRHLTSSLYQSNYRAVAQDKKFHIWKYQ